MSYSTTYRQWKPTPAEIGLAMGVCLCAGIVAVALAYEGRVKYVVEAAIAALGLAAVYLSGNPRLFCLWGFMLTMTLSLSKIFGTYIPKLGGETAFRLEVSDFFWVGLLAFQVRDIWNRRVPGIRIPKVTYVWVLMMLIGCAAVWWGMWGMTAAHEVVRMAKVLLLFLVICNELQTPGRFLHCAAGFVCAAIFQSIFGLIQFFTHMRFDLTGLGEPPIETINQLMSTSERTDQIYRAGALMIHPNIFGIFLAVTLPLAVSLFLVKLGRGYRALFFTAIVLGTPALIATYSRSSWAGFAAGFMVMMVLIFLHSGLRRRAKFPAVVAAVGVAVMLAAYAGPITKRLFESREGATLARAEFEDDAMKMIRERPWVGWGLNSYALAVPPFTRYRSWGASNLYQSWVPVVHNDYLLWWAETGILGLALHILVFVGIIVTGFGNLRVRNDLLYAMNAAAVAAMFAFLVDGFNSPSLRNNPCLRVFWVLAGIVLAVRYWRLRNPSGLEARSRNGLGDPITN